MKPVLGIYEQLVDRLLHGDLEQAQRDGLLPQERPLNPAESHAHLSRHFASVLERVLHMASGDDDERVTQQVDICNALLDHLHKQIADWGRDPARASLVAESQIPAPARHLLSISQKNLGVGAKPEPPLRPDAPLSTGCLLTGTSKEPSLESQLRKELATCDRLDILCSFIKWSGIRLLESDLKQFAEREGTRLRVITTVYCGLTEPRALDTLAALPNAEVRVSYDARRTRLHAKAYQFHRATGFGSAYIGSANLSRSALTDGLEWTIKISQREQPYLWGKVEGTFESYWKDYEFEAYTPDQDRKRLQAALAAESGSGSLYEAHPEVQFDLRPYPFQEEILERLEAERLIHPGKWQLVVAATGTGKTMVAAFDFRRWRLQWMKENPSRRPRLLFIAHREEILIQSLHAFRAVLRDWNFGGLVVGGQVSEDPENLFVSIQSYESKGLDRLYPEDYFHYVVVDEFHHAAAPSYRKLLSHVKPTTLIGLTATPERSDELDILGYFGGHPSSEVRLPDAIARRLLAPFQYFCLADSIDLKDVSWRRGRYVPAELDKVYTGNDVRAQLVILKVREVLLDATQARGLGFCVSVQHAHFMADRFNRAGLRAEALDTDSPDEQRRTVQRRLRDREINFLFVVDLFNEGVDIPEVDTVLFLRPTESLTVFLQQFGRGLRLHEEKDYLTVLDFVGQANRSFRFDLRFRALLGLSSRRIDTEIEEGFPHLPAGCSIRMERQAQAYILENIRQSISTTRRKLASELSKFSEETGLDSTLGNFLDYNGLSTEDIYRKTSWSRLRVEANILEDFFDPDADRLSKGLRRIQHIDDVPRIRKLLELLAASPTEVATALERDEVTRRIGLMLLLGLLGPEWRADDLADGFRLLNRNPTMNAELRELLELRLESVSSVPRTADLPFLCPIGLHASVTRDEILAALGHWTLESRPLQRAGVLHLKSMRVDVFFVTLDKTEGDFSPTTMYEDYAIDEHTFHWQSQSTTSSGSSTARRYIEHSASGHTILLFVRESRETANLACPYRFLGPADYESHAGSLPVSFVWRLRYPMPPHIVRETRRLVVA
jgi:superfamily II DNA or RNA helicase